MAAINSAFERGVLESAPRNSMPQIEGDKLFEDLHIPGGLGKVALVGCFETEDVYKASIYGQRTAIDLYARGIIGHGRHVGVQTISTTNTRDYQASEVSAKHSELTLNGLVKGIEQHGSYPSKNRSEQPNYMRSDVIALASRESIVKFGNDYINRFQLEYSMRQGARRLASNLRGRQATDQTGYSLVAIVAPEIASTMGEGLSEDDFKRGGIATPYLLYRNGKPELMWVPIQKPRLDLDKVLPEGKAERF